MRILILLLALAGSAAQADAPRLRLATTTSTENTGLLDALNPSFERRHGVFVDVIPTGTGKALRLGENGDVDVVLVHAPDLERAFVDAGFGISRLPVMHNDFVIVGPPADPAGIRSASSPADALARIASARATFVSRGDESGTHVKEKELWRRAGITPAGEWYLSVGQGMGAVLTIAEDRQAYTLSDRGTYLAYRDLDLRVLHEGAPELHNPYHVIVVNPRRHPHVNADLAQRYADYLRGPEGQRIIREFRVGGEPLFFPDAIPEP
jgi:tungstate transport system substrate-binding protein